MTREGESSYVPEPGRVWTRGYTGLMVSQFAGAVNDNLLKGALLVLVVAPNLWADVLGPASTGWVSFALTFPFIIFLGYAGQLADRCSKRTMVVWVRATELPIVLLIAMGFWMESFAMTFAGFLMIATQSAFFNPPKYGMIREVTSTSLLSKANGLIVLCTMVAIIGGMAASGFLVDGGRGGILIGLTMIPVAVIGLIGAWLIPPLEPVDRSRKWEWNPLARYWSDLAAMRGGPLFPAVWAWSFFYFISILIITVIPELQKPMGGTTGDTSLLLGTATLGIGVGCAVAGMCARGRIRVGMVPVGAAGLFISWLLLGLLPLHFTTTVILLLTGGISAGFFIVPLQAMQQRLAPPAQRARYIASANALSYVLMSLAALVYVGLIHLGVAPQQIFIVCSGCTLLMLVAMLVRPSALRFDESDYA